MTKFIRTYYEPPYKPPKQTVPKLYNYILFYKIDIVVFEHINHYMADSLDKLHTKVKLS